MNIYLKGYIFHCFLLSILVYTPGLTKPDEVGNFFHCGFIEIVIFTPNGEVLIALTVSWYYFY
jgi:hypothetical protein